MTKRIIWSPSAENDLEEILEYLSTAWNSKVASHFIDIVDEYVNLIAEKPKLFPLINEELKIRKCVLTKQNTLFYMVTTTGIEIIRIFDTRQDPEKLFDDL